MAGTYEPLARRLCRAVNDLGKGEWVRRDQAAKELKVATDELVQGAIAYAAQKGWIMVGGQPVHSLMLTPAGRAIGQRKNSYPYGPGIAKPQRVAPKRR